MAKRSLTALVWRAGMCTCFFSGDMSIRYVAVDCSLLHCLLKCNIKKKKKVRTFIPNHLQFLLRLLRPHLISFFFYAQTPLANIHHPAS